MEFSIDLVTPDPTPWEGLTLKKYLWSQEHPLR